ncbi:MAG: MMPL family transporter, partial [Bacteroidales bacterium]|nr:MMPL family transporter [Bacteroidales bacterium]
PKVLKQIKSTSEYMLKDKNLVNARSVADLFEQMNDVMGEGKKIPEDPEKVANLWFLLEGQEILEQLVSPELDEAMINATFGSTDIQDIKIFIDGLNQYILEKGDIKIEVTGIPSLVLKLDRSIITSQMRSLGIAIILVFIAVSFLMRSFLKGTIAIIPILVTLVILYGLMGLSGIPLDIATVLVGSISIGIGIDYSIHMITNLNHEMKFSGKLAEAIKNSIKISGKSIIINVMAVSFGFLILLWSNLIPLQRFGLLVSITMIASGLGSLTLLPAILILIERSKIMLFIKPIKSNVK